MPSPSNYFDFVNLYIKFGIDAREDVIIILFAVVGDRHMHNFVARGMHLHNISVITLGYRLATKGSGLDNCVDDVVLGIEKIQETFPTSNIFLAGTNASKYFFRLMNLGGTSTNKLYQTKLSDFGFIE